MLDQPETKGANTKTGAKQLAESLRQHMASLAVATPDGELKITISLGVVTALKDEMEPQALIARADKALYRAKHAGRNRVYAGEGTEVPASLRLVNAPR